jgi:YgiT-type zinc finger domain-containing protein
MGIRSPDQEETRPVNDQATCSVCGGRLRDATTTYVQDIDGRLAVVTDVPVQTCPQCGEQYFCPGTVDRLQQLLDRDEGAGSAPKTIQVPVFPFSPGPSN